MDCRQTSIEESSDNMVLDLCVRRSGSTTLPATPSPNRIRESPNTTPQINYPVTPYLLNHQSYPAYLMQQTHIKQEIPVQNRSPTSPKRDFVESSMDEIKSRSQPPMMAVADTTMIPNTMVSPNSLAVASLFNGFRPNNGLIKCTTRPFKAYPKDPTMILANDMAGHGRELLLNQESQESYTEFRRRMLAQVNNNNNNIIPGVTNPKMRRNSRNSEHNSSDSNTQGEKDAAYWERRRKNNEAAKRSRDARRAKEDEIAIRAAFLEHENMRLKIECAALRDELNELRTLINVNN
ncbi:protein giant [Chrysoperla carnea]|uniref:protein giant n=1 Tax=Chrysoperla carnea TaxID=189513 RepID=UPI001D095158|nr:protein giant [Chrysoperla carnea]